MACEYPKNGLQPGAGASAPGCPSGALSGQLYQERASPGEMGKKKNLSCVSAGCPGSSRLGGGGWEERGKPLVNQAESAQGLGYLMD